MADEPDPAVSLFFKVNIDGLGLGSFSSCEGLGCEVAVEQHEEGGNNGFVYQLPGRIKYPNVKLTRPLGADSSTVAKWFAQMNGTITRSTGAITAMSPDGDEIVTWQLEGVIPVKWTGPSLNVDTAKVAMETLELAHHGFLQ